MFIPRRTYLDLPLENGRKFYYKADLLDPLKAELDSFLEWDQSMDSLEFAKKMMFSHELKANNQVEGYEDDLELIEAVIERKTANIKDEERKKRILNLYKGYQFILKHKKMDQKHLKELYKILCNGLLDEYAKSHMGKLYREERVFILKNGRLDLSLSEGVKHENIERLMEHYFNFVNTPLIEGSKTDEYIKSQIMHIYFVYIHPYFDVNGRTSRTMAMWYLLLSEAYPFIIFNRGISFKGSKYDNIIRQCIERYDFTSFLALMLETLKGELEKEHVMHEISQNSQYKLSSADYQTLLYLLTMNGLRSVLDFSRFYNYHNDNRKPKEIYEEMLVPLIDAGILTVERYTKSAFSDIPNAVLGINEQNFENNPNYLKRIKIN